MADRSYREQEGLDRSERLGLHRAILRSRGFSVAASEGFGRNVSPETFRSRTGIDRAQYDALKEEYLDRRRAGIRTTFALGDDIRAWILSRPVKYFERRYGFEEEPTESYYKGIDTTTIRPLQGRDLLPEDYPVGLAKILARFDYFRRSLADKKLLDPFHIDQLDMGFKAQGGSVKKVGFKRRLRDMLDIYGIWGDGEAMSLFWETP